MGATRGARSLSPFGDFRLSPGQWDSLQVPVSVAFFFVNSSLDRVVAFYPGPAGATESLLPLQTWQAIVLANPALTTLQPDVEALLVAPITRSAARSASWCRSTRATSSWGNCGGFGAASTAAPRRTPCSTRSFNGCGRRRDDSARLRRTRRPSRASRCGTDDHVSAGVTERSQAVVHALALRCQIRIEPQRRAYDPDEEACLYELFGETPRWGDSCVHSCGPTSPLPSRGSRDRPRSTFPSNAPTTSKSRRQSISTHCAMERYRCCCCSADGVHPWQHRVRSRARRLGPGGLVPLAGLGVARCDGSLLSEQRLAPRGAVTPSTGSSDSRRSGR